MINIKKRLIVAATAAGLLLALCACGDDAITIAALESTFDDGPEFDYQPLSSPAMAPDEADVIVRGELLSVSAGLTRTIASGPGAGRVVERLLTLEVRVEEVIEGAFEEDVVYLQSYGGIGDADLVSDSDDPVHMIALATDETGRDLDGFIVDRPGTLPADAPILVTLPDGLWFQARSSDTMWSPLIEPAALDSSWGTVRTLDEYLDALREARPLP